MRNPQGYATIIDPTGGPLLREFDTITCIHCGGVKMTRSSHTGQLEVMIFRPDGSHYMKPAGFCRSCMKAICPRCDGKPCSNRFDRLDKEEAAMRGFVCL